jgi:hypothetical protein
VPNRIVDGCNPNIRMTTAAVVSQSGLVHVPATRPTAAAPAFAGLCLDCNYPLINLPPHRCAECGRPFDPADAETVNAGRPVPPYASWAVGPISWPVYAVALAGCGVTLWRARLPAQPFSWSSPVLWGWAALAAVWFAWPLVRRVVLRHYGWPRRVIQPMGRRHWLVPLAMVAMAVSAAMRVPPRAAFATSRPDMDRLARDVLAHPNDDFQPRRVGLFWAKNIGHLTRGGMRFVVDDSDVHTRVGFAYLPPGTTTFDLGARSVHYLGNNWWDWKQGR